MNEKKTEMDNSIENNYIIFGTINHDYDVIKCMCFVQIENEISSSCLLQSHFEMKRRD